MRKLRRHFLKNADKRQKVEKCLAEKTKKWKDKKILLNIKGKLRRHFFNKCREDKKWKDKKIHLDYQGKIASTFLKMRRRQKVQLPSLSKLCLRRFFSKLLSKLYLKGTPFKRRKAQDLKKKF